jgi:hypothetical protein
MNDAGPEPPGSARRAAGAVIGRTPVACAARITQPARRAARSGGVGRRRLVVAVWMLTLCTLGARAVADEVASTGHATPQTVTQPPAERPAEQGDMDRLFPSFADSHTVGLWLFDEPQYLNMTLTDASVAMYDLRLLAGGRLVPGRFGNALRMSAAAGPAACEAWQAREYEDVPDLRPVVRPDHLLDALARGTWTCEFWLRPDTLPGDERTVLELGTGASCGFHCAVAPADAAFILRGTALPAGCRCPTDMARLGDGRWHHVAFVREDGRVRHYLDGGEQAATVAGVPAATASEMTPGLIGCVRTIRVADGRVVPGAAVNVRVCGSVDFVWGDTRDVGWSERWRGRIRPAGADDRTAVEFFVECGGGARLTVGGQTVIDGLEDAAVRHGACELTPGRDHDLTLDLVVRGGVQRGRLSWRKPGGPWKVVPGMALGHTLDDTQAALEEAAGAVDGKFHLTLGAGRFYDRPLDGLLDELRFSDVARYRAAGFAPGSFSRNHGADPPRPVAATGPPLLFAAGTPAGVVALGSRRHVFVDDVLVASSRGVRVVAHPPRLRAEDVKGVPAVPDSVAEVDGRPIRFIVSGGGPPVRPGSTNWDGRMFEDPVPGVRPEERFKYAGRDVQRGIYLFVSPDGVHWRRNETIMLPFDPDGGNEIFWDDQRGLYVSFMRQMGGTFGRAPFGRAAAVGETNDVFRPWPFQPLPDPAVLAKSWTLPSITGELPVAIEPHPEWNHHPVFPARQGQVYRTRAVKYPWAPDAYYAFVWRLFSRGGDEIRATELAVSRDGRHWTPLGRPWFYDIDWELEPGFRVAEALAAEGMVRQGDELWTYCSLREGSHTTSGGRSRTVRFVSRLDGFTSLAAGGHPGWLVTRPFTFAGDRLELNVAARGKVRVGLLDEEGNEIPGATVRECDPVTTDAVRQTVTWNGDASVGRLAGRPVRLRIEMQDADLHALQFVGAKP